MVAPKLSTSVPQKRTYSTKGRNTDSKKDSSIPRRRRRHRRQFLLFYFEIVVGQ